MAHHHRSDDEALRRQAGAYIEGHVAALFVEHARHRHVGELTRALVNLPAFLGVPLGTYVLGTFVGIIPGSFVYASVGNGLGAVFDAGGTPDLGIIFEPEIILPIVGLALLAILPVVYKKIRGRAAN